MKTRTNTMAGPSNVWRRLMKKRTNTKAGPGMFGLD